VLLLLPDDLLLRLKMLEKLGVNVCLGAMLLLEYDSSLSCFVLSQLSGQGGRRRSRREDRAKVKGGNGRRGADMYLRVVKRANCLRPGCQVI